ncbi:MAG: hypothetical protein KAY37_17795, partial [Phycisphaerae bacterium]|nr:hypothetical protein [Phycisphaerae bacterium]
MSIESTNNSPDPDCVFLWMSAGGGMSLQWEVGSAIPPENTNYNRGLCLTGPCLPPSGACCLPDGSCADDVTHFDCLHDGGEWQGEGTLCSGVECPPQYEPECPPETIWGQPAMNCEDAWSAATSAVFPGGDPEYRVYDNFAGLSCEITGIRWWGLILNYERGKSWFCRPAVDLRVFDGCVHWWDCDDPVGMTYEIKFYQDNGGVPGTLVCTYDVVPTPVQVDDGCDHNSLYYFEADLLPGCFGLTDGWVSIQSQEDLVNECVFRWMSSPYCDEDSLQEDVNTGTIESTNYDRAFCLTGPCPSGGACCMPDLSCLDDQQPGDCTAAGGKFMGYGTPCYCVECPPWPKCPPDETVFGQPSQICEDEWSALVSDPMSNRLAYENFSGVNDELSDIHWWGQSVEPGTDQACDPATLVFTITFYPDDAGLPDYANPTCTYTGITPTITQADTGCVGGPLWYFETQLTPSCVIAEGWVSIWDTSPTCEFRWFSSAYGDGRALQYQGSWPPVEFNFDLSVCLTAPTGACCYPDGSCEEKAESNCEGVWLGADTDCGPPNPCPQPGACCYPDGSCDVTLEADCTGDWLGAGTVCVPNPCPQPG